MNKIENIIILKNVESNVIQEAIVILKDNINIRKIKENNLNENKQKGIDIIEEAEILVNQKLKENEINYQKFLNAKLEKKIKFNRIMNVIFFIIIIFLIIY
jgi:hypothetical protein